MRSDSEVKVCTSVMEVSETHIEDVKTKYETQICISGVKIKVSHKLYRYYHLGRRKIKEGDKSVLSPHNYSLGTLNNINIKCTEQQFGRCPCMDYQRLIQTCCNVKITKYSR